jgi:hypothetical protein
MTGAMDIVRVGIATVMGLWMCSVLHSLCLASCYPASERIFYSALES